MTDRFTVRAVVLGLVVITLAAMVGAIVLLMDDKPTASVTIIAGFGTTALGGLIGVLASTRTVPVPPPEAAP